MQYSKCVFKYQKKFVKNKNQTYLLYYYKDLFCYKIQVIDIKINL